jgi:peptide/nickel transport system permease protein
VSTPTEEASELATVDIATATRSARALAWQRRSQSSRRTWREFRRSRSGMFGLVVLVVIVLVAVFAPWLANSSGLDITQAEGEPMHPPYPGYPMGTDYYGRSILTLLIWGRGSRCSSGSPRR